MNQCTTRILLSLLLIAILTPMVSAQSVQIRLSDGSTWRGEIEDKVEVKFIESGVEQTMRGELRRVENRYIVVYGEFSLRTQEKVIFRGDVRSIRTLEADEAPGRDADAPQRDRPRDSSRPRQRDRETTSEEFDGPGVIVLPLKGMVGVHIRHQEIEKIGRKADEFGPGQTIILEIDTGGGMVIEMEQIARVIQDVKRRHRVIAWVHEAISAGCATAIQCEEIYFTTMGTAGAMTAFAGDTSWSGNELQAWLSRAGEWMQEGGRDPRIAHAMIHAPIELSYDKDSETGEVTFYSDLRGRHILSRKGDNLTLTSDQAVHSGFANGIADTTDELAKHLDLPRWHELTDYGRRMHEDYMQLVERAEYDITMRMSRLGSEGRGTGDGLVVMQRALQNLRALRRWHDRAPNVARVNTWPPEVLDELIRELEREIRRMRQ